MRTQVISMMAIAMLFVVDHNAHAADLAVLPAGTMIEATGSLVNTTDGASVRVTPGSSAVLSGAGDTVIIEKGGSATISGNGGKVYVMSGASAVITGSGVTVYSEAGSSIVQSGQGGQSIPVAKFSSAPAALMVQPSPAARVLTDNTVTVTNHPMRSAVKVTTTTSGTTTTLTGPSGQQMVINTDSKK